MGGGGLMKVHACLQTIGVPFNFRFIPPPAPRPHTRLYSTALEYLRSQEEQIARPPYQYDSELRLATLRSCSEWSVPWDAPA